ncbi:hypothetical protein [Kordia sp.]|uniref:hypothetical protein n=1 Tax=Kordia sp. TaxID=1965332 RepID=UPI003D6AAD59
MKLIIFKKTVLSTNNVEDYDIPKKLTRLSFLGITFYQSKEFYRDDNSEFTS